MFIQLNSMGYRESTTQKSGQRAKSTSPTHYYRLKRRRRRRRRRQRRSITDWNRERSGGTTAATCLPELITAVLYRFNTSHSKWQFSRPLNRQLIDTTAFPIKSLTIKSLTIKSLTIKSCIQIIQLTNGARLPFKSDSFNWAAAAVRLRPLHAITAV